MSRESQAQRAGANASQIQIAGDYIVHHGLSEERAVELYRQNFKEMYAQYSEESRMVAQARVDELEERLIPLLAAHERLDALADPAFQGVLRKAQFSAASTERTSDYELLGKLLADRIDKSPDRRARAGINRAVEVVDQLDDEALVGLTAYYVVSSAIPGGANPLSATKNMETLFERLIGEEVLPSGAEWLDHLDILDLVRVDTVQQLRPFDDIWPQRVSFLVSPGLEEDSAEHADALGRFAEVGHVEMLVKHEYKPGFVRVGMLGPGGASASLANLGYTTEQIAACNRIAKEYCHAEAVDPIALAAYMSEVRTFKYHKMVADWWDSLPHPFSITAAGRAITHANLKQGDRADLFSIPE